MYTAFGLGGSGPAAEAAVLAGLDGCGAGPAADRPVALIDERMPRQVLCVEPGLDLFLRPVVQRIDPDPTLEELERPEVTPVEGLAPLAAGDHGVDAGQSSLERTYLAKVAAGVGVDAPQVVAGVEVGVEVGEEGAGVDLVAFGDVEVGEGAVGDGPAGSSRSWSPKASPSPPARPSSSSRP